MLLQPRFQCDGGGLGTAWGQATWCRLPLHASAGTLPCRLLLLGDAQSWDRSSPGWREQRGAPAWERVPAEPCIAGQLSPPQGSQRWGAMRPCLAALLAARQHLCSAPVPSACLEIIK